MKVGTVLHGFQVVNAQYSDELGGTMYQMDHVSGAKLYYLDNKAENKVFSIAFRTMPEDHSGVFHILEHSVLCGSAKYPVKEPFVDLLKGSMNTFLNAMTFPDKTVFPVSSRNEKDYCNLVSVYLDAVFCPRLLIDPRIFQQEGWHIELDESGNPVYSGVVFNEMKGAMSQLGERISQGVCQNMYPDTCYCFNSGGDPEYIPSLSYDACVKTYHKYYQPSNSIIYIEGAVPLHAVLHLINPYLSLHKDYTLLPEISEQIPVAGVFSQYYELASGISDKNRVQLSYGRILGTWKDRLKCMAAEILCDILAGSNEAPLTSEILQRGLAQDVSLKINASRLQFDVTCTFHNIRDGSAEHVLACLHDTVEKICVNGIDREELIASINQMEFADRQPHEPQGIARAVQMLNSTLYGGDPLLYLEHNDLYHSIRNMLHTNEFENLLYDMFLRDIPSVHVYTIPSYTYGQEQRLREEEKLKSIQSAWTVTQLGALIESNHCLKEWQQTSDGEEEKQSIPRLHLKDIGDMPIPTQTIEHMIDDVKVLFHPLRTDGIVYFSMYISLSDFSLRELTIMSLLCQMMGMLPTLDHAPLILQREIKKWMGDYFCTVNAYSPFNNTEVCCSCLLFQTGFLEQNMRHVLELIQEIIRGTVLEREKIYEFVMQMHEMMRQSLVGKAHTYAMYTALSHFSSASAVNESCRGITKWKYLDAFVANFDEYYAEMQRVYRKFQTLLGTSRILLSEACEMFHDYSSLIHSFPQGKGAKPVTSYHIELPLHVGYCIPGQSSSTALAYRFPKEQLYTGPMAVASHLLSYGPLWKKIRLLDGAYGAGMSIRYNKSILVYSYRDPNPERSIQLFKELYMDLEEETETDIEPAIIACIAAREPLSTPREEAMDADIRYLTGYPVSESERIRSEILHTTKNDLKNIAKLLQSLLGQEAVCVLGHEAALEKCDHLEILSIEA